MWYALQPTAPPRLAGAAADTVTQQTFFDLQHPFIQAFYNPVAAMPSLHVGLAPVVAWALWRLTTHWPTRALGLAYPLLVATSIVVTGNHYLLDIAGGLVVVLPAAALARYLTGRAPVPRHAFSFPRIRRGCGRRSAGARTDGGRRCSALGDGRGPAQRCEVSLEAAHEIMRIRDPREAEARPSFASVPAVSKSTVPTPSRRSIRRCDVLMFCTRSMSVDCARRERMPRRMRMRWFVTT